MNCATHSDTAAVAFCRTCGKPLCNQCTRDVRGVIYCEACLAARMEGAATAPAAGFVPPAQTVYPTSGIRSTGRTSACTVNPGPNPAVAGILAGLFPIGVGAVYTGQYAKGLSHLGHHGAADHRGQLRLAMVGDHGSRNLSSDFSTSTRSSMPCAAPRQSRWANPLPIRSDWRRPLAPARNSKPPKFPLAPPFSSAWACCSSCTPPGSLSSAWIASGRSS